MNVGDRARSKTLGVTGKIVGIDNRGLYSFLVDEKHRAQVKDILHPDLSCGHLNSPEEKFLTLVTEDLEPFLPEQFKIGDVVYFDQNEREAIGIIDSECGPGYKVAILKRLTSGDWGHQPENNSSQRGPCYTIEEYAARFQPPKVSIIQTPLSHNWLYEEYCHCSLPSLKTRHQRRQRILSGISLE